MGLTEQEQKQLDLARQGDDAAFFWIVETYQNLVARTIKGMIGNHQDADDLGQLVFVRFHKNLSNFRGDSSIGTYLCRIAINLCKNHIRKMIILRKLGFISESSETEIRGTQANIDLRERMRVALAELPLKAREILVLRYIQGFSMNEIAETLNIPLGTVLSRLARAEAKLKTIWLEKAEDYSVWKKENPSFSYTF